MFLRCCRLSPPVTSQACFRVLSSLLSTQMHSRDLVPCHSQLSRHALIIEQSHTCWSWSVLWSVSKFGSSSKSTSRYSRISISGRVKKQKKVARIGGNPPYRIRIRCKTKEGRIDERPAYGEISHIKCPAYRDLTVFRYSGAMGKCTISSSKELVILLMQRN